jgi:hypothetical protein
MNGIRYPRPPRLRMGYTTYRIFRGISLDRLAEKVRANLNLYEPGLPDASWRSR